MHRLRYPLRPPIVPRSTPRAVRHAPWRHLRPVLAWSLWLAAPGCVAETDTGGPPDDGRVHPPPNGVHIGEGEACVSVQGAFRDQALALGCSATTRLCPEFLRSQFGAACMEYDQGSVAGCVEYYQGLTQCGELDPAMCVVIPYPGTEPAGCPP